MSLPTKNQLQEQINVLEDNLKKLLNRVKELEEGKRFEKKIAWLESNLQQYKDFYIYPSADKLRYLEEYLGIELSSQSSMVYKKKPVKK